MIHAAQPDSMPATPGRVIHWAAGYDLLLWLRTLGRERTFREKLLQPAQLRPGESVLDVGCGTGTLALAAKKQVGPDGAVFGVDASPQMIARAIRKAKKAGAEVGFQQGVAESLPFPAGRFDVVVNTVMLHHLPRKIRRQGLGEMRRVLKAGGRLLAVDFVQPARERRGLLDRFHRHGHVDPGELATQVSETGLRIIRSGPVGIWDLQFVLAESPRQ